MALIIGGRLLPNPSSFTRIYEPNETDNRTLAGNLYTDFVNNNRVWKITWQNLKEDQFDTINDLYKEQYVTYRYHAMQFDAYNTYTPVKINLSEQDIKYNGSLVDVSIIVKEQYAFS